MNNVCIIPARGGSKRIPGKNMKLFNGKPIIQYTIEKALKSGIFHDVVITTDHPAIAEFARDLGALVPFIRPAHLSDDYCPTADVIHHALVELEADVMYDYCCVIYATAPFIRVEDLHKGYDLILRSLLKGVFSVTTFDFPIQRALLIDPFGYLFMREPVCEMSRSQDLRPCFHDAGQFYWLDVEDFLKKKRMYADPSKPVIVPRVLVQDIDTFEDWERAEVTYKVLKEMGYEI